MIADRSLLILCDRRYLSTDVTLHYLTEQATWIMFENHSWIGASGYACIL